MDVKIKWVRDEMLGDRSFRAYDRSNIPNLVTMFLEQGCYRSLTFGAIDYTGWEPMDIAEDLFDLSNNPYREEQRMELMGRGRSLSVGDIVEVNGINYLCAPMGWEQVG